MDSRPLTHRTFPASSLAAACLLLAWLALPACAAAQSTQAAAQSTQYTDLIRAAMQNQVEDNAHLHLFSWKERKDDGRKTKVERQLQTPSGIVSRVVLINDQPLNPAQQTAEDERTQSMVDPEQMRHALKEQRDDNARTRKMLLAIPDAFDFTYLSTSDGADGHKLVSLSFTPRPGYDPPSRETMVFTGMRGEIQIDETASRIVTIDGTLFKDVTFGWGIFGRLYKGGRFVVEQAEIAPSHWDTTHMLLHFDGRELIFKSIHIYDDETSWDFQPVPPMSAEEALDYLNRPETAQNAAAQNATAQNARLRR